MFIAERSITFSIHARLVEENEPYMWPGPGGIRFFSVFYNGSVAEKGAIVLSWVDGEWVSHNRMKYIDD